jgi:hypothetical protein
MMVFRLPSFAAVAVAGALAASAVAAGTVRDINVTVGFDTAAGANALGHYPDIAADLTGLIADELPVSGEAEGYTIDVTLESMTLDGDTALPDSREFNRLSGVVHVTGPGADGPTESFPINLAASTAEEVGAPDELRIDPGNEDFYIAMLAGFAEYVAQNVPQDLRGDQ